MQIRRKSCWSIMDEVPIGFRSCSSCTRSCYKEHRYPSRDSLRPPCFVKALCDSNLATMATCWMVIPSAWLKLYGDEVGNSAVLHGPSGNTWQVGVGRPKWVAFRVGWRTFAADNGLEKGDMLVFTLIGRSEFSVKIFDSKTCLEKECALTATNTGCYDSRSPVQGEKRKQRDDEETAAAELKRICLYNNDEVQAEEIEQNLEIFRNGSALHHRRPKPQPFSSAGAPVSHRECTLLDLNAQPLYFLQTPPANEGGRSFPEVHHQLLDVVGARTLQGYASGVVFQPHPIIVRSHDIGDECLSHGQPKTQECTSGGGGGPATRFASQRRPVMDAVRERSSELLHRQSSSGALITSEHSSQLLDLNREHSGEAAGPPILSPAVILEREKALELARRAQQGLDRPSHLVVLRPFHVHGRAFVRFPVTFGKQHMPRKTVPMNLLDANGHRWPMSWLRDNETHMGLTRGWREFCLAEGLSEGDVCVFELLELNNLTLLVHVFRSTEARDNTQIIVAKPKRPDSGHPAHQHSSHEKRRRASDREEKRRRRKEKKNLASKEITATTSEGQNPFVPSKMVLYNEFHRLTVTDSPRHKSRRREKSPAGSVGRERLKTLSLWATKEQLGNNSKAMGFSNGARHHGPSLERCSKDDVHRFDPDVSKVQEAACGEILCQMSSGGINPDTPRNSGDCTTRRIPPGTFTFGAYHNNAQSHPMNSRDSRKEQLSQEGRRWRDHRQISVRSEPSDGVKSGCNTPRQWAKTRKRYRKQDKEKKKRTWGWTWGAPSSSAQKRKTQASKVHPRFYLASKRAPVTDAERAAAQDAARALKTENPAALVVMKASNVYKNFTVELPPTFLRAFLPGERCNILLHDAAGQKTRALLTHKGLMRGWAQFALKHLLEEGDVCVFELTDSTNMTLLVHIFRVMDIDPAPVSYCDHYRIISRGFQGIDRRPANKTGQPRSRNANRHLYRALQRTRAKHSDVQGGFPAAAASRKEPLDLNLNLNINPGGASSRRLSESPSRKLSPSCGSRSPAAEMEPQPMQTGEAKPGPPSSGDHHTITATSPPPPMQLGSAQQQQHVPKDVCETTSKKRRKHATASTPRADERMVMPLPADDDDSSEVEEGNYYRVVRILKKRYFRNEKQYLAELDGPVLQSDGCGGLREYDDIRWWVPEKSFSTGFASCYLR